MWQRILSGVILAPLFIFILIQPLVWPLLVAIALLGWMGIRECLTVSRERCPLPEGMVLTGVLVVSFLTFRQGLPGWCLGIGSMFLAFAIREVASRVVVGAVGRLGTAVFLTHYVPGLLAFSLLLKSDFPKLYLFTVVLSTWANDTLAYFVGVTVGKRRLIPEISPLKTVEGAIGGLLAGTLFFAVGCHSLVREVSLPLLIFAGLVLGLIAQIGDLVASLFKRDFGAKDFSQLVPGHGGIMDRLDSLLLVFPSAYVMGFFLGLN